MKTHRSQVVGISVRLLAWTVLCAGSLAFAQKAQSADACAVDRYKVVELPLAPNQINDAGLVAGTTSEHQAATWSAKNGLSKVPALPGLTLAEGRAVSSDGRLLGVATEADGSHAQAFVFSQGKVDLVIGDRARGNAMNTAGDFAGEARLSDAKSSGPALWQKGKPLSLGACCGGRAIALNDSEEVVGEAYDKEGRYRAFLWDAKQGLRLIGPEGKYTSGVAINPAGHVLVYGFTEGSWIYRDGNLQPLKLSERWPNQPHGINACDVVVGGFGANSDESHAFLWDPRHGFRDLNDLIPKNSGWTLEVATSINNRGEIVGKADHGGEDDAGFLLVPEP